MIFANSGSDEWDVSVRSGRFRCVRRTAFSSVLIFALLLDERPSHAPVFVGATFEASIQLPEFVRGVIVLRVLKMPVEGRRTVRSKALRNARFARLTDLQVVD